MGGCVLATIGLAILALLAATGEHKSSAPKKAARASTIREICSLPYGSAQNAWYNELSSDERTYLWDNATDVEKSLLRGKDIRGPKW